MNETQRRSLISGLHNISYTGYTPKIIRSKEDYEGENPFIVVSFLPRKDKYSEGHNYYLAPNGMYSWYGYGTKEDVYIRAFSEDYPWIKGRYLSEAWVNSVETYLKTKWNNIITGATLDRAMAPARDIGKDFIDKYYGYELGFTVNAMKIWTDSPTAIASTGTEISGIIMDVDA